MNAWCTDNNGYPVCDEEALRLIGVKPSERQLAFSEMKYYSFIHFGVNTFTDREWGNGTEDESIFNPSSLNTDQWCEVLKKTGSKGIILTAKHHDGFCLFNSKYTEHTVMRSPYGRDIVKELGVSCKKYGMKLGLYLSPWDRHEKTYGTEAYNDFFVNQLTELCTNYGELFCLWFDGACGEGKNGKKQVYDWNRYYSVIRQCQPNAVISISGPDVRWIGNEGGKVRKSEWSVISWTDKSIDKNAENSQHNENEAEKLQSFDRVEEDLGSREMLKNKSDLAWSPAEADVSVTKGWFWHDEEYYKDEENGGVRTPEELAEIYFNTVGGNASMLLNVPVNREGLISDREIKTLGGFAEIIANTFKLKVQSDICILSLSGE
ncbi:MAG: alpha-L-fucosidase [Clostridiales bacterium]|nr:alpha-L-fucosidase [Clostridiales bacterium]